MTKRTEIKKNQYDSYNTASEHFIPIACHYDENTMLTKNGELLQIIQIQGINAENISTNLFDLRKMLRQALENNIQDKNFALWIHTIRREANLDDNAQYNNFLSANIHEMWANKNHLRAKYVNRLYISIIYNAQALKIDNSSSFINSLSPKTITNLEDKILSSAHTTLNNAVDNILDDLSEYGAKKLGITFDDEGNSYSEPMFLYRKIIQLEERKCLVPITDISKALASHHYSVGNDKMEVIGPDGKKFAAILSVKEYHEVSADALDVFLQTPVEMISTEIFYFVDEKEVTSEFEHQDYILTISKNSELKEFKGLNKINDQKNSQNNSFCHQRINFLVMSDDLATLDIKVARLSRELAKIGIVHIREDINLEKVFWSQLPANFSFLHKMTPTILQNIASMSSLHSYHTGNKYSPWGRAITLLSTERGTPFFMNFHNKKGHGNTYIFGPDHSGTTSVMNFLISESYKYNPSMCYITNNKNSMIFIKALGGRWIEGTKNLINPLQIEDTKENQSFIKEFFQIIANHFVSPLSEEELKTLDNLSVSIFKITKNKRTLSNIIDDFLKKHKNEDTLQERLEPYGKGGEYQDVFSTDQDLSLGLGDIIAFNLEAFNDELFKKNHYPKEKKYLAQYNTDLNRMRSVRMALIYAANHLLTLSPAKDKKILAIDNLAQVIAIQFFTDLLGSMKKDLLSNNGVSIHALSLDQLLRLSNIDHFTRNWMSQIDTCIIMPQKVIMPNLDKILGVDEISIKKLSTLKPDDRVFLMLQDDMTLVIELDLSYSPGTQKILSADDDEIKIYNQMIKEHGEEKIEDWLKPLYEKLASY